MDTGLGSLFTPQLEEQEASRTTSELSRWRAPLSVQEDESKMVLIYRVTEATRVVQISRICKSPNFWKGWQLF